jgi:hypothetical protein
MPETAALRMSREIAGMGARLARFIAGTPMAQDPALEPAHAFLLSMYEACGVEASPADETHPIDLLAANLALTAGEIDLVVLAAMADEHEGYASTLRRLHPRGEPQATAGLAARLGWTGVRERFALRRMLEEGAAVRAGVISLAGDGPFFERSLILADGLGGVLSGLDGYPPALRPITLSAATSGLECWLAAPAAERARRALGRREPRLILVVADAETSAADRAAALVATAGRCWCAFERAVPVVAGSDRLALVHALARDAIPIFRIPEVEAPWSARLPDVEDHPGPVVVCARRGAVAPDGRVPVLLVEADPLPMPAREQMWRQMLPELAEHAPTLAVRYLIEPAATAEVARDLRAATALDDQPLDLPAVADSVRVRSHAALSAGVKLVRPTARWGQLVLPPDRQALINEALDRLLHQGTVFDRWRFLEGRPGARGVRMLLSGPPGTGKTLTAEVMAGRLGVDLMVVDISRVVSKWIGETEKHLAEAFDAAERSQAVLLFDEADALFGKRTDVSDAHDRYANLETAYLLSRLERFEGLAILSTNLKHNIDAAFLRRLEFVIDLEEPSVAEREALWRCHLPPQAPLGPDVDLKELAALYPIAGGLIRNASVAAGFLAASGQSGIGRRHLISAIRREYDKAGKAFPGVPAGVRPV